VKVGAGPVPALKTKGRWGGIGDVDDEVRGREGLERGGRKVQKLEGGKENISAGGISEILSPLSLLFKATSGREIGGKSWQREKED